MQQDIIKLKKNRLDSIKECKEEGCGGKPVTVDFTIKNFCGKRCEKCYLITEYKRDK